MQIRIKINGDNWKVKVVTPKVMKKQKLSEDTFAGLCVPSEKTIYLDNESIEYDIILHELYHAYFSYLYLDDTNSLTLLDLEEISANFFCSKAAEMLKKAKVVQKRLKTLQEEGTEDDE